MNLQNTFHGHKVRPLRFGFNNRVNEVLLLEPGVVLDAFLAGHSAACFEGLLVLLAGERSLFFCLQKELLPEVGHLLFPVLFVELD